MESHNSAIRILQYWLTRNPEGAEYIALGHLPNHAPFNTLLFRPLPQYQ